MSQRLPTTAASPKTTPTVVSKNKSPMIHATPPRNSATSKHSTNTAPQSASSNPPATSARMARVGLSLFMLSFLLYPPVFVNSTKLNSCLYEESTHQGERLCGRVLPSVPQVSEKNS